jgi:hypothetical protein
VPIIMKKSPIFLSILLLIAIGVVVYGSLRAPQPAFHGKLADILPPAPAGWSIKPRQIADTPEMMQAVGQILNYDDGIFVDYTNGLDRLSVYMAYWTPGKMSHRIVASHTPDVCWVANGWVKEMSETVSGLHLKDGSALAPAEGRLFSAQGQPEYVWFWHVVGANVKSYATGFRPPWYAPLTDILAKGINQREEQYFIRISSDKPLDSNVLEAVMRPLLERLPLPKVESGK